MILKDNMIFIHRTWLLAMTCGRSHQAAADNCGRSLRHMRCPCRWLFTVAAVVVLLLVPVIVSFFVLDLKWVKWKTIEQQPAMA
jgi:hypothetical protein